MFESQKVMHQIHFNEKDNKYPVCGEMQLRKRFIIIEPVSLLISTAFNA